MSEHRPARSQPGARVRVTGPPRRRHTPGARTGDIDEQTALGGVTRFVDRREVTHVEAHGDYARLHTAEGSHLIRVPLTTLEEEWAGAGFVRIHRSLLVSLAHVTEIRMEAGRCAVAVGSTEPPTVLQVSRRHTRELRELLGRRG